jgi:lipopolysaccharide assembly protein A
MQFLKTLFWVLLAVIVYAFASSNWSDVTINLWSDLRADVKLPLLLVIAVLIGFLPTFLILRGRIWSMHRRLEAQERSFAPPPAAAAPRQPAMQQTETPA